MLTVTNVPIGYDGYLYRALVGNGTSCTTISEEATLSVSPPLGTPEYNVGQMVLYPNPAVTHVFIKIPFASSLKYCKLEVFDSSGRILLQKTLKDEVEKVDVDNLPNGVYIFTITSEYGSNSKKIIKQ
ncbi:T9SS C-terminal target domain-containing protein [Flavobacterium macacae]|uniref:T9SS C-terminal target domain-containing protein n=2 Tax=Flavobacterium macacae TaxID=2488993 RepID=A0A3P3WG09_9FLAO|nr:T9SS C-terminal target domain-containing protein [Flavobacterium macacae]